MLFTELWLLKLCCVKTEFPFAENEKNERELSKKSDDGIAYLQKHESRLLLLGPLPEKKASNAKAKALPMHIAPVL